MKAISISVFMLFFGQLVLGQSVKNTFKSEGGIHWSDTLSPQRVPLNIKPQSQDNFSLLRTTIKKLKLNVSADQFVVNYQRTSPVGYHVEFGFSPYGVPMALQFIKLFVSQDGVILDAAYQLPAGNLVYPADFPSKALIKTICSKFLEAGSSEKAYVFDGNRIHACRMVRVRLQNLHSEERYYSSNGQLILSKDMRYHFNGQDSLVKGKVFLPDPLTSALRNYSDTVGQLIYKDFLDADSPAINLERYEVPLQVTFEDDTFKLANSDFYFADFESPYDPEPLLVNGNFDFTRSDQHFEFVNIYYHLTNMKRIVNDLEYDSLPGFIIQVDAHGFNNLDASAFDHQRVPPALTFGDGGIDDGEDADVIVHEYGHALSFGAAPGTSNGVQRRSIDEGQSDYLAMSYSRRINSFNWEKTFNWDGNETWPGRSANSTKILPDDYSTDIYSNGEIWASAFTEIYDSIGSITTDKLVLGGLYFQFSNMSMQDMAYYTLIVDSLQNGGANKSVIRRAFDRRRILYTLSSPELQANQGLRLLNSVGFTQGESVQLEYGNKELISGSYRLLDVQGKVLDEGTIESTNQWEFQAANIKKGLYILQVELTGLGNHSFRLVRH